MDIYFEENQLVYQKFVQKSTSDYFRARMCKSLHIDEKLLEQCNALKTETQRSKYFLEKIARKISVADFTKALNENTYCALADLLTKNLGFPDFLIHECYVYGERLDSYLEKNPDKVESLIEQLSVQCENRCKWYNLALELSEKYLKFYITGTWIDDIKSNSTSPQEESLLFIQRLSKICSTRVFLMFAQ